MPEDDATKLCSTCNRNLPLADFPRNRRRPDALHYYCRECTTQKSKDYQAKTLTQLRMSPRRRGPYRRKARP